MINWTTLRCLDVPMSTAGIVIGELSAISGISRSQLERINAGMAPRFATSKAIELAMQGHSTPRIIRKGSKA